MINVNFIRRDRNISYGARQGKFLLCYLTLHRCQCRSIGKHLAWCYNIANEIQILPFGEEILWALIFQALKCTVHTAGSHRSSLRKSWESPGRLWQNGSGEFPTFKDTDKKRIYALFDILYIIKKDKQARRQFWRIWACYLSMDRVLDYRAVQAFWILLRMWLTFSERYCIIE